MYKKIFAFVALVGIFGLLNVHATHAQAEEAQGGFSVQVTPSPLIATLEPGVKKTLELRINNTSSQKDTYTMQMRAFTIDSDTGEVAIQNDEPADVSQFITFDQPEFSLEPGEWINQRVVIDTPVSAGFSYSFAILVARKEVIKPKDGTSAIQGSVAVFTLLNVNKPDAVRKLEVLEFTSKKKIYEYLPADFSLVVKNSGNTIVSPGGNIFVGRGENDPTPLQVVQVNEGSGYIIPGSERTLKMQWGEGFPAYVQDQGVSKLKWDFSQLSKIRIGKYTAKAIVLYDDGERDIPIEAVVTFWVFPWKIILAVAAVLVLLVVGVVSIVKKASRVVKKKPKGGDEKAS